MPGRPDWRSSSAAQTLNQLDRAGFAWEFLRRNPDYRKDYRRIVEDAEGAARAAAACGERWGLVFRLPPELPAAETPVLWRPELLPHNVVVVPAPTRFAGARRFRLAELGPLTLAFRESRDLHILLKDALGAQQLWLRGLRAGQPMAVLIPLDEHVLLRIGGLLRLQRRLAGEALAPLPNGWALTARLRRRLVLMVRALDGHMAQATYREIAVALYGSGAVARYSWKTSSIRGQTIRLVKDAVVAMKGGYRKLLRGGR